MGTQYFCANENRRDAVRFSTGSGGIPKLNGIDYLEVTSADEKTLEIHCIHNLPGQPNGFPALPVLSAHNFVIEGGVRITDIEIMTYAEVNNVVTLTVSEAGDYSTYTLRLVTGEEEELPPSGFDIQLSALTFSFKVECPSDFDCQLESLCQLKNLPAPLIDYLAKDYSSFRRLMLDRLSVIIPNWTERSPADLQVALVESIAYVGDQISYYQDAVASEAYLGTARQRISMRRHARLLDYNMHEGCNARAWMHFQVEPSGAADGLTLPDGTPLLTRGREEVNMIDPLKLADILQEESPAVFETLHDLRLDSAHNKIRFYTWDDSECCLPKGATHATLYNDPQLALQVGDLLLFEEVIGATTGLAADADPAHRHVVRLTSVITEDSLGDPLVDPLHDTTIAEISWDAQDALPFPLCISTRIQIVTGPQLVLDLSVARGNIALADHGYTLPTDEVLGNISVDSAGRLLQPILAKAPLTQQGHTRDRFGALVRNSENEVVIFDSNAAATTAIQWQMRDVLPAVKLIENGDGTRPWLVRHDLLASSRFDRHFVVEIDNDTRAHLRFGDGFHAAKPKPDATFTAHYRVGSGKIGNVGAEAISRVVLPGTGINLVRNPLAASGGRDPESLEQVRQYAPQAFRTQERAVTAADYAEVTERHPEVQKAAATLRWTGSWYTVFITVDRMSGRLVDASFENELRAFVERFRMAGEDIEIDAPRFVPLEIIFTVCVKSGYYRSQVHEDLLKLFSCREFPNGTLGFFHPDNFTFGQPVYLSQLIALVMDVPGVQWVDAEDATGKSNRFRRWGQPAQDEFSNGMISFERLEIARLDNDPSLPENGKLDFIMEGGL
ncbi:MAG: putative baseplate assembly protein [Anaerolineaceae bacterium]|nr:putative baseplate assembly protein [Anaerolineaceae bacterium]